MEGGGGTQWAFMRRHGLLRERLRSGRSGATGGPETKPALGFVPVEVAPAPSREETVVVEVGGVRVRVDGGASQELVARVLRAVKEVQGAEAAGGGADRWRRRRATCASRPTD